MFCCGQSRVTNLGGGGGGGGGGDQLKYDRPCQVSRCEEH